MIEFKDVCMRFDDKEALKHISLTIRDGETLAVIGGFALFHGMAHGGELEQGSTIMAGIVLGSAILHGIGMTAAHFVLKHRLTLTLRVGQLVALIGGGLVLSTVL